jgi:hypothetical protein
MKRRTIGRVSGKAVASRASQRRREAHRKKLRDSRAGQFAQFGPRAAGGRSLLRLGAAPIERPRIAPPMAPGQVAVRLR